MATTKPTLVTTAPTMADIQAEIARLKAENEQLKAAAEADEPAVYCAVGESGAVSYYMGIRFPASFHAPQWLLIAKHIDEILAFVESHKAEMAKARADNKAKKAKK